MDNSSSIQSQKRVSFHSKVHVKLVPYWSSSVIKHCWYSEKELRGLAKRHAALCKLWESRGDADTSSSVLGMETTTYRQERRRRIRDARQAVLLEQEQQLTDKQQEEDPFYFFFSSSCDAFSREATLQTDSTTELIRQAYVRLASSSRSEALKRGKTLAVSVLSERKLNEVTDDNVSSRTDTRTPQAMLRSMDSECEGIFSTTLSSICIAGEVQEFACRERCRSSLLTTVNEDTALAQEDCDISNCSPRSVVISGPLQRLPKRTTLDPTPAPPDMIIHAI